MTRLSVFTLRAFVLAVILGFPLLPAQAAIPAESLPSLAPMLEKVSPAVVNLSVRGRIEAAENPMLQDPLFRRFFEDPLFRRFFEFPDRPPQQEISSIGSGVIVDAKKGHVVTNHHVVAEAKEISVVLNDRRRLNAKVVGSDPESDIAVLEVEAKGLTDIPFGDSNALKVGDFVVAIGNPFGIGQTATMGIVSALGRTGLGIEGYENFIQTDASINPGNSGGALVDQQGRLIGINTAIFTGSGGNIGIGFAIPANMVRDVAGQLIAHGEVRRGRLGVLIQDLTPDLAEAMGVKETEGALISEVVEDSPAASAGLRAGDVVVSLDGRPVRSSAELRNMVGLLRPGQHVKLEAIRDGGHRSFTATLGEAERAEATPEQPDSKLAGATFSDIPPDHPLYGEVQGVLVREVEQGSRAARAGLNPGDIIVSANQKALASPAELVAVLREQGDKPLLLRIRRGRGTLFLAIR